MLCLHNEHQRTPQLFHTFTKCVVHTSLGDARHSYTGL